MLVDHLLEAGGSGAMVPWYNVRKDLFLDKVGQEDRHGLEPGFISRFARFYGRYVSYQALMQCCVCVVCCDVGVVDDRYAR